MKIKVSPHAEPNKEYHEHLTPLIKWLIDHGHPTDTPNAPKDMKTHYEFSFSNLFDVDLINESFDFPDNFIINPYQILDKKNAIFLTTTRSLEEMKEQPLFSNISMSEILNGDK